MPTATLLPAGDTANAVSVTVPEPLLELLVLPLELLELLELLVEPLELLLETPLELLVEPLLLELLGGPGLEEPPPPPQAARVSITLISPKAANDLIPGIDQRSKDSAATGITRVS